MVAEGPFIVFLLFLVRLAIPLMILLGLGYLYERHVAQQSRFEALQRHGQAAADPAAHLQAVPCWEIMECPLDNRQQCVAAQRPGVPCWLALQLAEGHLPDRCIDCQIFKTSSPQHHLLA
jgi:hypothetical protein